MSPLFMPPSLSRFRATRAGLLALFCAGVLRVLTRCSAALRAAHPGLHICLSLWTCAIARVFSAALRLPRYCATLRLPTLGYTFVFPFGHALSRGCSLPLMSPFGLLMQPTAQPPCCLVPSQRPLACVPVSSFRFPVYVPLVFHSQNSAFNPPPPCSPCPRWSNPSTQKIGQMARLSKSALGLRNRSHITFLSF